MHDQSLDIATVDNTHYFIDYYIPGKTSVAHNIVYGSGPALIKEMEDIIVFGPERRIGVYPGFHPAKHGLTFMGQSISVHPATPFTKVDEGTGYGTYP